MTCIAAPLRSLRRRSVARQLQQFTLEVVRRQEASLLCVQPGEVMIRRPDLAAQGLILRAPDTPSVAELRTEALETDPSLLAQAVDLSVQFVQRVRPCHHWSPLSCGRSLRCLVLQPRL